MNPQQAKVIDLTQNKKLQTTIGKNKIKGLVVYDYNTSPARHKIELVPSQQPMIVLVSNNSVVRSVEVWATVDDNKGSETKWSGKFSMTYTSPKIDTRSSELTNRLLTKIANEMNYFSTKEIKTLNMVIVGGLGDGKSELCGGLASALGSNISFQSGRDFITQTGAQHSITKSGQIGTIPLGEGGGVLCIWNIPGFYETLDSSIVEKEPALNYFETLLTGNMEPETIFMGNAVVPTEFNQERRTQVVVFTITAAQLKTDSSFSNFKSTYSKYINHCNKYGVKYMFVLTKFDDLSDNYLKYDGATLKWTGSKFESCPHNSFLYSTLAESPEYLELESHLASHFKTSLIFPVINKCDENKKYFDEDSTGIMEIIRKNQALQIVSNIVDLGTKSSHWQNRQ